MQQLEKINALAVRITKFDPFTNVYGIARVSIALGTLSTLLFNNIYRLYPNKVDQVIYPISAGITKISLFSLLGADHLELSRNISVAVLLLVITGWRPRYTGILHWWITFSFFVSCPIVDGGDQLGSILTLLLIPICLMDSRKWHWDNIPSQSPISTSVQVQRLVAWTSWWVIRIQMAALYFHAAVGKLVVAEWVDGTSLYYWFNHNTFGMHEWVKPFIQPLLRNSITVTLMTWSVLLLEVLLFAAFFMDKKKWPFWLKCGLAFHFMIVIVHGLISFFFSIGAGLILYLRPLNKRFEDLPQLKKEKTSMQQV